MARRGFKRKYKPLEILSKEDVQQIKNASLDILRETGVVIQHKKALKILSENDCIVNFDEMRARFPEGLVQECLGRCPNTFRVKARDPKNDIIFNSDTVYFKSSPGMYTVDLKDWTHRIATEKEFIEGVIVLDALEHHDWFSCYTPYFGFQGIPEVLKMTLAFARTIKYSTKFSATCFANYNWEFNFRIAKAASTETMCPALMFSSPLTLSKFAVEAAFKNIEYGFASGVDTGSVFGATAPATLAGALALFNAELISGLVLIQLIKPYSRAFVWGFPNAQNMKSGSPAFGNIANALFNVANNQIWRDYGVPIRNTASAYTSSKKIDFQNGIERALPAILSALSGASTVHLYGGIYGELTHHPIQAILDDDLAGMIGRFIEGISVNDETIALDLIHSVGPIPGHYLDQKHTHYWWKSEQYLPQNADLLTYPEWERFGKKDCIDYARERMKKILSEHEVSIKLSDDQEEEINDIIREAEMFYNKKGALK